MSPALASKNGSVLRGVLSIIVVTMMVACCFVVAMTDDSEAVGPTSGTCGANLNWSIDTSTDHLTITGTGPMNNYYPNSTRWGGHTVRSVSFPSGMTTIGNYAFYQSELNTEVTIPSSVTTIGNDAFSCCSEMPSVSLSSVTSIGSSAFSGCHGLTSVTIPATVATIGDYAFVYCSKLLSVTFNNGVGAIGESAFAYCEKITTLNIPDSVGSIGMYAFAYCTSLRSVSIGTGTNAIDQIAFSNNPNLTYFNVAPGNTSYSAENGVLFNKGKTTLICYPMGKAGSSYTVPGTVTNISAYSFMYNKKLTTVTIPDNVNTIGTYAFANSMLTDVTIGTGLNSMNNDAFRECLNLRSFTVAAGNASYSSADGVLFNGDKSTLIQYPAAKTGGSYTVPSTVKNLESYAFAYNDSLTSVTLPTGLTGIGFGAFCYCSDLTSMTIPDSVTSLGSYAFMYCSDLTGVRMGTGITSIGTNTFAYCVGLTEITIPNNVTSIGSNAFAYCSGLTTVTLGNKVNSIQGNTFLNCPNLMNFNVPTTNDNYTTVGGILFSKDKTTLVRYPSAQSAESYTIPDTVVNISAYAFQGSRNLVTVNIPASVENIQGSAFNSCLKLTSFSVSKDNTDYCSVDGVLLNKTKTVLVQYPVGSTDDTYVVPKTVTSINNNAFTNATNLTSIELPDSLIVIGNGAFSGSGIRTIHIPANVMTIGNGAFNMCTNLESFSVSSSNDYYCTIDGILYTEDGSQFIQCPSKYEGTVMIPDNTDTDVARSGLAGCSGITGFTLKENSYYLVKDDVLLCLQMIICYPSGSDATSYTVSAIFDNADYPLFYASNNLEEITVDEGNIRFSSRDGCMYAQNGSTLITCPSGKDSFTFTSDVKRTGQRAFSGDGLKEITFASDCDVMMASPTFVNCNSLKKIVIEEGADVNFSPNCFMFTDNEEHTIYVVAPDGYTIDESCFMGNVNVIYGEPPKETNLLPFIIGGVIGVVVLAGVAVFIVHHIRSPKGGIE